MIEANLFSSYLICYRVFYPVTLFDLKTDRGLSKRFI
jgi:hypothetical protein